MTSPNTPKDTHKTPPGAFVVKPKKERADWDAIERDYRTAKFTLRELETKHGTFASSIARKAKSDGWVKDLTEAIRQATNARLTSDLVDGVVNACSQNVNGAVNAAAEVNTRIILGHRTGLKRITSIKEQLLDQIEQAAANMSDLADVIEMVRNPDDNGMDRANDALKKAMGRSALVDDLKKLADVDEKVRKGEREAFSLNDAPPPDSDPLSSLLKSITSGNSSSFQPVATDPAHDED